MSRCVIILLMLATVPCTDQLHTPNAHGMCVVQDIRVVKLSSNIHSFIV